MNLEDQADREQALTVACPYCTAAEREPCVRKGTDEPLTNFPAHPTRLHAAGVMHAPLDTRELRHG